MKSFLPLFFALLGCFGLAQSSAEARESMRIDLQNRAGGEIRVSRDQGVSWSLVGHVILPYDGRTTWDPLTDSHKIIPYYGLIHGPSNVMVVDPTVIHLRIADLDSPDHPLGIELFPLPNPIEGPYDSAARERGVLTDLPTGTGVFAGTSSPGAGAAVLIGDGENFVAFERTHLPRLSEPGLSHWLMVEEKPETTLESIEFENVSGGTVRYKALENPEPVQVAILSQAIQGTGRFSASAYARCAGAVVSVGVAHIQVAASVPLGSELPSPDARDGMPSYDPVLGASLLNRIAGFELTTAYHFHHDFAGSELGFLFGLLSLPPDSDGGGREWMPGIEGSRPLFWGASIKAGSLKTQYLFSGDDQWHDLDEALRLGRFSPVAEMRGVIRNAFDRVKKFRLVPLSS